MLSALHYSSFAIANMANIMTPPKAVAIFIAINVGCPPTNVVYYPS